MSSDLPGDQMVIPPVHHGEQLVAEDADHVDGGEDGADEDDLPSKLPRRGPTVAHRHSRMFPQNAPGFQPWKNRKRRSHR
ncbi:MAG: hypothetical protein WCP55_20340 [Lentisphaerota bacterium]